MIDIEIKYISRLVKISRVEQNRLGLVESYLCSRFKVSFWILKGWGFADTNKTIDFKIFTNRLWATEDTPYCPLCVVNLFSHDADCCCLLL